MEKIVAAGPVIVKEGKLLVTLDKGDLFFKIPGGKPERTESLEECVLRELNEETGFWGKIGRKLSTIHLTEDPDTGKQINVFLYHFKFDLENFNENFDSFEHNNHKVCWINLSKLENYNIAPNIKFLFEKGELN